MSTAAPITSITFDRNSSEDIMPQIPEYLYAYTDPNVSGETLYAWTYADNNETCYTKTPTLASDTPLYDKDGEAIGSISGLIIDDDKFSSDINYVFTNEETLSILTNLYNDEFITVQASDLEDFIATILGLQPSDISLANLQFVLNEVVYTDSIESNIITNFNGIDVHPNYYFLVDGTTPSNGLALFLFLGTDRVFFIGYFDNTKIDTNNYGLEEITSAMGAFLQKKIRTQTDFHRIFLDTQSCDITTGYLGVEITDDSLDGEFGRLCILAGDKGNTLLYCFDANSPWTNGNDSYGTTTFAESSNDFGELTSDSFIEITNEMWKGLSSIFDLIESSNTSSYDRDTSKDTIIYDTSETLYAWTTDLSDITVSTVYTTDAIPTNTSVFYDENGNVLDITTIRYPMYEIDSFNSGSSTECIFNSSPAMQQ